MRSLFIVVVLKGLLVAFLDGVGVVLGFWRVGTVSRKIKG